MGLDAAEPGEEKPFGHLVDALQEFRRAARRLDDISGSYHFTREEESALNAEDGRANQHFNTAARYLEHLPERIFEDSEPDVLPPTNE